MRLEGKVAVITGAGSGMGRATAKLFCKEGAKVLVADINSKSGQETVEEIKKEGGTASFIEVDVGRVDDNKRMVETAINLYQRLDILFNNAGYAGPKSLEETTEENWHRLFDVLLTGPFFACKYAVPYMRKQGSGNILFTASAAGVKGVSRARIPAYTTAKGGVIMLGDCLSRVLGKDNIRVNVIVPSVTDSPFLSAEEKSTLAEMAKKQIALGKPATPEDIAFLALFLASDESSHVTGAAYSCDGGHM